MSKLGACPCLRALSDQIDIASIGHTATQPSRSRISKHEFSYHWCTIPILLGSTPSWARHRHDAGSWTLTLKGCGLEYGTSRRSVESCRGYGLSSLAIHVTRRALPVPPSVAQVAGSTVPSSCTSRCPILVSLECRYLKEHSKQDRARGVP